jgi:hypothetical protein
VSYASEGRNSVIFSTALLRRYLLELAVAFYVLSLLQKAPISGVREENRRPVIFIPQWRSLIFYAHQANDLRAHAETSFRMAAW